ncbi:MAG: hypothetical protein HQL08_14280 [Nitrospirae bacterium]|nr:hypothetical protein [Nitrospirota bacterium]
MLNVRYPKNFISGRSLKRLLFLYLSLFFFAGCASSSSFQNIASRYNTDEQITKLNFGRHFEAMAEELCGEACKEGKCANETILVTDFVDVQSYVPQKTGMLMGELMRSDLSKACGYTIAQVEFSNLFRLSENGLITLTRNPGKLQSSEYSEYSVKNCIVGTYSITTNKLYLFARIINTSTGRIIKMTHREIDLPGK